MRRFFRTMFDPGAMDAFVGKIISSVLLAIRQRHRVSTIHISTFRKHVTFLFDKLHLIFPLFFSALTVFFS